MGLLYGCCVLFDLVVLDWLFVLVAFLVQFAFYWYFVLLRFVLGFDLVWYRYFGVLGWIIFMFASFAFWFYVM